MFGDVDYVTEKKDTQTQQYFFNYKMILKLSKIALKPVLLRLKIDLVSHPASG